MMAGIPGFQPPEQLKAEKIGPALALYPGREGGEKVAWYQLHAHASTFPRYLP